MIGGATPIAATPAPRMPTGGATVEHASIEVTPSDAAAVTNDSGEDDVTLLSFDAFQVAGRRLQLAHLLLLDLQLTFENLKTTTKTLTLVEMSRWEIECDKRTFCFCTSRLTVVRS